MVIRVGNRPKKRPKKTTVSNVKGVARGPRRNLGGKLPKPKAGRIYKSRQVDKSRGFLRGETDRSPVTHHEKRLMNKIQRWGANMNKQRYEDFKSRQEGFRSPIRFGHRFNTGGLAKGIGTKAVGPMMLGFQVHLDKSEIRKTMEEHTTNIGRLAHNIALRTALGDGYNEAIVKLELAYHLGGQAKSRKIDGDVFSILKGSLAHKESGQRGGRWIRHVAGSFDNPQEEEPTGVKGYHEGKMTNLTEMYEEGVNDFPYGNKLFLLFATQGARRSRAKNYMAYLKAPQRHPGFPRVQFMQAWYERVMFELNQETYDDTLNQLVANLKGIAGYSE